MRNIQNWRGSGSQYNYNAWNLGHRLIVFNNRKVMGYSTILPQEVFVSFSFYINHLFQAALTMATALDGDGNVML